MKQLYIIFVAFLSIQCYCQTIKQMENELTITSSGEVYGDKIKIARLLHKQQPYNKNAIDYICDYYKDRKIDSVTIFFDKLIADNPNNPKPYLLSYDFAYFQDSISIENKLAYLFKVTDLDAKNIEANYKLAKFYYDDFITPFKKIPEYGDEDNWGIDKEWDSIMRADYEIQKNTKLESYFKNPASDAYKYFEKIWQISPEYRPKIYYPMRQLACWLRKSELYEIPYKDDYFPTGHFMTLAKDWECDFSIDLLFEYEMSEGTIDWIKEQLIDLKEPNLYLNNISGDIEVYRFTWLRSFHNPIAVRIEKIKDKVMLYWSIGRGMGGYAPKGIKKERKRKISVTEWNYFIKLITASDYSNLPNEDYTLMNDGALWVMEHKKSNIFEAKANNNPGVAFTGPCNYLIKLANIKISEKETY